MDSTSGSTAALHKCAHEVCACMIPADQEYCSDVCKGGDEWAPCQCGHAVCAARSPEENVGSWYTAVQLL